MALLLSSFVMTGCGTILNNDDAPAKAAPDFCATASPIYIAKADQISDATAREILNHNLIGRKLCGW